jgi:hypothetical protein
VLISYSSGFDLLKATSKTSIRADFPWHSRSSPSEVPGVLQQFLENRPAQLDPAGI